MAHFNPFSSHRTAVFLFSAVGCLVVFLISRSGGRDFREKPAVFGGNSAEIGKGGGLGAVSAENARILSRF
jgi:hypothetical protein